MSNAAAELADLLDSWHVEKGHTIADVRGTKTGGEVLGNYRHVTNALRLLQSIDSTLRGLAQLGERVDTYIRYLPAWYEAILATRYDWASTHSQNVLRAISQSDLDALRMLASYLDHVGLPDIGQATEFEELEKALREAADLVVNEPRLGRAAAGYLLGLINDALDLLANHSEFAGDVVRHVTHELSGAMHTVADSPEVIPDPEQRGRWAAVAKKVGIVVIPSVAAFGVAIGSGLGARMVEGGSPSDTNKPATSVVVTVDGSHDDVVVGDVTPPGVADGEASAAH